MQNRKRPADIIRFAAPGNRKTHTQVKTHRLRILFIDICLLYTSDAADE